MSNVQSTAIATIEDGDGERLNTLVSAAQQGYVEVWSILRAAHVAASEAGDKRWAEILNPIVKAASMSLVPGNAAQPFRPLIELSTGRSALPDDLSMEEVRIAGEIASHISNPLLAARLHDIAWLRLMPRDPQHALQAIDAYRSIPLTEENWINDGGDCWIRAISLAKMVRIAAGERVSEIEAALEGALFSASAADGHFALRLADTLKHHRFMRDSREKVADHLRKIGDEVALSNDFHRARDYLEAAAEWFKLSGNVESEAATHVAVANQICADAALRVASEEPSHMASAALLEEAIHTLRKIPNAQRGRHGINEKIDRLRLQQRDESEKSRKEMGTFTTDPMDITELVKQAEAAVSGKPFRDAIAALVSFPISNFSRSREDAVRQLAANPFSSMFGGTVVGRNGQVVAKVSGFNIANPDSQENEPAIHAQMVRSQTMLLGLRVSALILPALDILRREHRVPLNAMVQLAERSPVVPPGRAYIIGLGLHYGFEHQWPAALHLLVPQVEHLIRFHLNSDGVVTTMMDQTGVVNEVGLSTLMTYPEVDQKFGPDLSFEIKSLFCDHFGPNLRNELAHGLLSDAEIQSAESVYSWWFMLRLVKRAWLQAHNP